MNDDSLAQLTKRLDRFAKERDWEQFHTPKNLAMALTVEAAELLEHFQWLTAEESAELSAAKKGEVQDELGDLLIYAVRLADRLNIDIIDAAHRKHDKNKDKYPADKVRGSAAKYTEYQDG